MEKRITRATIKSFINKNQSNLFISFRSNFDGMVDCVMPSHNQEFAPVVIDGSDHGLGIKGAWFVGSGRDYFKPYEKDGFTGFEVSNSCGSFVIAVRQ